MFSASSCRYGKRGLILSLDFARVADAGLRIRPGRVCPQLHVPDMTAVIARQEQHVIASVGLPRPGVSARRTGRARPAHKRQHCGHAQACAAARRPAVSF